MIRPNRPRKLAFTIGLVLIFAASGALALTSAEVIAKRQASFKSIGGAFKTINDGLKTDTPDLKAIAAAAGKMHAESLAVAQLFPRGSGPEAGVKTRAKPEIWTDTATFATAGKGLQIETAKLQKVAATGDLEAVKAQVKVTGNACGTCHKPFRAPES